MQNISIVKKLVAAFTLVVMLCGLAPMVHAEDAAKPAEASAVTALARIFLSIRDRAETWVGRVLIDIGRILQPFPLLKD